LRGRVVDARTGKPIAKVRVIISGTDLSTTTGDNGEFTFDIAVRERRSLPQQSG
jgi:hypothetical protein